ncbi:MAG: hypothetical protein WAN46_11000 [Gammaproteobacteria bacterium]|jgi:glutaminase
MALVTTVATTAPSALDAHGNSVRGVKAFEVLSTALGLNILDAVPAKTERK